MKKSVRGKKNSNQYTLGCEIRNHVAAIKMGIETLRDERHSAKGRKILDICYKSTMSLLGISVLPEVENISVDKKLADRLANYSE